MSELAADRSGDVGAGGGRGGVVHGGEGAWPSKARLGVGVEQ
jgi:hypothetical protein